MLNLQDERISEQVYEALSKLSEMSKQGRTLKFETKQNSDNTWKCYLNEQIYNIPVCGFGDTEVDAINRCAGVFLSLYRKKERKQKPEPLFEEKMPLGNDCSLMTKDVLLDLHDPLINELFNKYLRKELMNIKKDEKVQLIKPLELVTIRLLVKSNKGVLFND